MVLGDVTSGIGQTAVYTGASVMSAAIIAGAAFVEKRRQTASKKLDQIYNLLAGEEPSDLKPNPEPGLVKKVDEYQKSNLVRKEMGDKMIAEFETWKDSQKELSKKFDVLNKKVDEVVSHVKEIGKDSKALVADSRTNGGSTTKDQLNRIEDNTKNDTPRKARA